MRRTIFTASLLSALSCLCTPGYSQLGTNAVSGQSQIGQATDSARNAVGNILQQGADQVRANANANTQVQPSLEGQPNVGAQGNVGGQANITGQLLQNQTNAQLKSGASGLNTQAGVNSQVGGANTQAGLNGQVGSTGRDLRIPQNVQSKP